MYWMDAAGLYTAEPSTQKLRKAPEINTLTFRPTFVISRSGVRVTLLAPRRVPNEAERRSFGTFLHPKVQTAQREKPLDPSRDPNADRRGKHRADFTLSVFCIYVFVVVRALPVLT